MVQCEPWLGHGTPPLCCDEEPYDELFTTFLSNECLYCGNFFWSPAVEPLALAEQQDRVCPASPGDLELGSWPGPTVWPGKYWYRAGLASLMAELVLELLWPEQRPPGSAPAPGPPALMRMRMMPKLMLMLMMMMKLMRKFFEKN